MKEYDFALNWSVKTREVFINVLKSACQKKNLSFLWISNDNVKDAVKGLESGQIRIKFLLDTEATYDKSGDIYARVCYAVKDSGGVIINDPDRARVAVDKSVMHYELMNGGVDIPYSVILRNWQPKSFRLTEKEKEKLKIPFVIKPALGYSRQGVIEDARGSIREIAQARDFDPGDNFLLQEKIKPIELDGRRAWFRVFHAFEKIIPCWWDDRTCLYSHVTQEEFKKYNFAPLAKIVAKIAEISRMLWFSTEIAIDSKSDQNRFVAIDYVNDQCDMTAQSQEKNGIPDAVVSYIAENIVKSIAKLISNRELSKSYTVWLDEDNHVLVKGLGEAPEPLMTSDVKF